MQSWPFASLLFALVALSCLASACEKDRPSVSEMSQQIAEKEAKQRLEREATLARERTALDATIAQVREKRRPLDAAFSAIFANLPDPAKLKRIECPDARIAAETPDPARRALLLLNKESIFLLTGKAQPVPDGGAEPIHTVAAYHAFAMRRAEGKETPLLERTPPVTSTDARAQLDAIEFIAAHRYIGVGLFTAFHEGSAAGAKAVPARLEGFTVIFDQATGKPLCQVEASGEQIVTNGTVSLSDAADEEVWFMFTRTTSKNLDAVTKLLSVDGLGRKKP